MAEYFDVMKSIINKQKISDEDIQKHFAAWPASQWLSANYLACFAVNALNSSRGVGHIPKEAEYRFLKNAIKLPRNTWIEFDKNSKDWNLVLKAIGYYFKISRATTREYLNILGGEKACIIVEKMVAISERGEKFTEVENKKGDNLALSYKKVKKELLKIKGK